MISHKAILLNIKLQKERKLNPHSPFPKSNPGLNCIGWDVQPLETEESLRDEADRMTGPPVDLEKDFIPF